MQIRRLVLSSAFLLAACGGGKKPAPAQPTPTSSAEMAAAPGPETKEAAAPVPAPPPAPKLVLGDAKIAVKAKKKTQTMDAEIVLAADGTLTATVNEMVGKKKEKKTKTGKLTADGQMMDDQGEVVAKIGDGGAISARQVREEKQDGKVVKSDVQWEDVGTLSDDGVFTNKKDGKTMSIDDKGKLTGFPPEMQFTVTAGPEQKKAAMFVIIGMFAASKMTMDSSGAKADAVPVKPIKK